MSKNKGLFSWFGKKSKQTSTQTTALDEKAKLLEALKEEALQNTDENVEIILFDDPIDDARIEAARVEAARVEAARIEAARIEAARIEAARIEAARIEAARIEAARIEAARIEAARIEAARIEAERIEAERIEAERIEAERIEAERIEAERIEAERIEASLLEAERIEAERIEASLLEAARLKAEKSEDKDDKLGFFARFRQSLTKSRLTIGSGLFSIFKGKQIDEDLFEELEEQLIIADMGVETTLKIIENLTQHANRKQLKDAEALYSLLKEDLSEILATVEKPLVIDKSKSPYVILMVGVNGVGKTTTIGKLAKKYQQQGLSVMLAAGDTFRAAAVEQLQVWGDRNNIPVIAQQTGADSASVLFDAMDAARARGVDVLIADTAGRLQNKDHLMDELSKVVRIMRKKDASAPHEIMLTIDAGTGQNAISQVNLFNKAVGLTGITLTKLDGTAKGGIIFSLADKFKLPIRYIGTGEGIDDLREFNAQEFIDALFSKEENSAKDDPLK
ncbi:signal recognition particle-docking protein FtsY [Psychromonas sp. CNPT3]|uniref:signal recognition particle-docking protein FtsY n=1 Tax=Psychromonas sp. CNPT3 TaxID=314282 RepID=UPI00006E8AB3|nr:signal recognition particle-docking protein FtsY [Psychromonas sp. CNPT3]AGH80501.1 signal recognition particle-docking protein FtsY [Psychromonas sp. CNPT3]